MLDPRIILAGQGPDIVGSLSRGMEAGQQANQIRQQNDLAGLYKTQGAGILAGDQGALNALAGIDPMAAVGVQDARLGMDAQRQSMSVQADAAKRAAAEYARGISAEQAAAEAAQIERAVKAGLMAPNAQAFDMMMTQMGVTDLVGKFDQRDAFASQFMTMAEVLKQRAGNAPQFRQATPQEAQGYGAAGGQFGPDGRFYAINPPSKGITQTITNPDGTTTTFQVGGAANGAADKATLAAGLRETSSDVVVAAAARAREAAKGVTSTGLVGAAMSYLPNTDAAEVYRQVDVLKSNATVENLTAMRQASPTGGALGSVTEKENAMLAAKAGALDPKSPNFQRDLDDYEMTLLKIVHGPVEGARIFNETRTGAPAASTQGAAPQTATRPPAPEAVEILRQNDTPEYRAFFDEVFGPGAAARVLGGQ